ncbi:ABC transporter substrate-binding protein [Haloterrigena sp. SYSU A558-1]|uniref:ABC transporter substrate-binding protein n=1 Tax=Haloterrigena gelatinilytica TaxID=2741724 RepID=A0ABX2LER1_9EURY|nr:ABC transporter substrate-binding protein [Haloterrigena gelatinilytica]
MRTVLSVFVVMLVATAAFAPAAVAGSSATAVGTDGTSAQQDADLDCEYPIELTDATGETVTIDEPPEEIVALQPSDAQTTYAIGAEDKVVGMPISQYTDYLEVEDHATDISEDDGSSVDTEQVIDLEPDVVIAANTALYQEGLIEQLRDEAGLTVYVVDEATSIDDVYDNVAVTGQLAGECEGANDTIEEMAERLDDVEPDADESPTAYYAMGDDGTTAGPGTFNHDVLEAAGLENIAEEAGVEGWGEIDPESVVDADPDLIVYPDYQDEPPVPDAVESTTAYQNGNTVAVNDNFMNQPGPMIVETVETLAQAAEEQAAEEEDETSADGEEDTIPGFGAPVAVAAALAGVGILARRR